jgi:hypothetical protein
MFENCSKTVRKTVRKLLEKLFEKMIETTTGEARIVVPWAEYSLTLAAQLSSDTLQGQLRQRENG